VFYTAEDIAIIIIIFCVITGAISYGIAKIMRWIGVTRHVVIPAATGAVFTFFVNIIGIRTDSYAASLISLFVGVISSIIVNVLLSRERVSDKNIKTASPGQTLSPPAEESPEVKQQNAKLIEEHLKADAGDPDAQYAVACRYDSGNGVSRDFEKAFYWWMKAAQQGHSVAQFNLASMYENGDGVPKNYDEAFKWYSLSANQGYAGAINCVGNFYKEGFGVEKNLEEAFKHFQSAAQKKNAWGCYNLGMACLNGEGCSADRELAIKLLTIAADNKIKKAQTELNKLQGL